MIRNTTVRICVVAVLLPLTYGGACLLKTALVPPGTDMPDWTFRDMPKQFGDWRGEDATLDPKIALATGAKIIVDRTYRDGSGSTISMHTAMFDNPAEGVMHSPLNCYRNSGWERSELETRDMQISDDLAIPVSISVFRRGQEKVAVAYWYQLGEHVLFGRLDLGVKVRWSLAGKPKWPALIKVMLSVSAIDSDDAKSTVFGFAEQVAKWENQPKHRNGKGMLGLPGDAASDKKPSAR